MKSRFSNATSICLILIVALISANAAALNRTSITTRDHDGHKARSNSAPTPTDDNGIFVDGPKVYDDTSLQFQLNAARAKLASLQTIDQGTLLKGLGAISGATLDQSGLGVQVSGAPTPSTDVTTGATPSTKTSTPSISSPTVTVPAGQQFGLQSGMAVNSLDLLNEQMQLTYEIANLQLLLEGSLSDRFVVGTRHVKRRMTLGFPIRIAPKAEYKDAVAVVSVEMERTLENSYADERPAVTALLPREKTYNVAAITDRMTSIGGGLATHVLSAGFSWIRGRKTFYVVQDQDTVALTNPSTAPSTRAAFAWQFRPVLGQSYVRTGLKQTFVQLALPTAWFGCSGTVYVKTYWQRFDRKHGLVLNEMIPNSVRAFSLAVPSFDPVPLIERLDCEDLGSGQVLVSVLGKFLGGTYVRVGGTLYGEGSPGFRLEPTRLRFVAGASDIVRYRAYIVHRDGTELQIVDDKHPVPRATLPCSSQSTAAPAAPPVPPQITAAAASTYDDNNSILTVRATNLLPVLPRDPHRLHPETYCLVIGDRVFGLSDNPITRSTNSAGQDVLQAVVPTSLLVAAREVRLQPLFESNDYSSAPAPIDGISIGSSTDRLVLLTRNKDGSATFLLYGNRLTNAFVLSPWARLVPFGGPNDRDTRIFVLNADQLKAHKQIALQKDRGERPIMIAIPAAAAGAEEKPPEIKARARITVGSDEAVIVGDGLDKVKSVKFKGKDIRFRPSGKSIVLLRLLNSGVTLMPGEQEVEVQFENGTKASVTLDIVNGKIEIVERDND